MNNQKKALLVSDNSTLLELQEKTLSNRGIQLFTASSEKDAIEIHSRENVNLVVCGLRMSATECSTFCNRMRNDHQLKNVSIIMISSHGSVREIEDCIKAGADDYLCEPIDPLDLLQKAAKFINLSTRTDTRVSVRLKLEGRLADAVFVGFTLNLSSGGFLLETNHKFLIGETSAFSLSVPESAGTINVIGKVVRKSVGAHHNLYFYGIRFVDLNNDDRLLLEDASEKTVRMQGK